MKIVKLLAIPAVLLMSFTSCKKEGCTDSDADNYSAEAKKEDNSCTYSSNRVMWYGEDAANFLVNDGATSLTFYVDGEIVGSSAADVFFTSAPDCGTNGSITVTADLGNVKSLSYSYEVIDQTGWTYWSGILNFTAGNCAALELAL